MAVRSVDKRNRSPDEHRIIGTVQQVSTFPFSQQVIFFVEIMINLVGRNFIDVFVISVIVVIEATGAQTKEKKEPHNNKVHPPLGVFIFHAAAIKGLADVFGQFVNFCVFGIGMQADVGRI